SDSVALTIMGLGTMVVALLLASVCLVATVVSLRPSGMALHRVPAFSWSMFIAGVAWMLALPLLLANLVIIYADLRGRPAVDFGREAVMWEQVRWAFTAPQVFVYAVPALGIAAEVVPVAAKVRQKFFPVILGSIAAFAMLGFGGYLQTAFAGGQAQAFFADPSDRWNDGVVYMLQAAVLALPVLILLGGLAGTLRRGRVRAPQGWMAAGLLSALLLLVAAGLNLLRSVAWFEFLGTSMDSGVADAVLIVALLGAAGGIFYWMPKLTGTKVANGLGMLGTLALLGGAALAGLPAMIAGMLDQPDFDTTQFVNASFEIKDEFEVLNLIGAIGFAIAAAGALLVLAEVARVSLAGDDDAGDDPWGGHTLEWSTVSPPPLGNFAAPVDAVMSESPLLDRREAATEDA
ncbi:MAG: hypothetical protein HKN26_00615, partial [Acidimicrobiales bacterium]|nr:hypothetical protein [Acidimicrobiales bacterium]